MAKVITAPERYDPKSSPGWSVFLAGAIDMGTAVNWQQYVIDALQSHPDIVLLNPRRMQFTADTLDEQIQWELDALERVDMVFLWFPAESKAPISFFEAGLYWRSGKLLVGAEPGFYRRRNLEIAGYEYFVHLHASLESMLHSLCNAARRYY